MSNNFNMTLKTMKARGLIVPEAVKESKKEEVKVEPVIVIPETVVALSATSEPEKKYKKKKY